MINSSDHKKIAQLGNDPQYFTSASSSAIDKLLAAVGPYELGIIMDTTTWQIIACFHYPATTIAFSPDNKQLAAGNSRDINNWDVETLLEQ